MPRAVGPLLVTGVAIVGAAAIVANPILPPPTEIRVSPSDLTADGQPIDVLDPDFLKKVSADGSGWPSPLGMLDDMVSGFIGDRDGDEALQSIEDVLGAADPPAGIGRHAGQPMFDVRVPAPDPRPGEQLGLAPAFDASAGWTAPLADLIAELPAPQQAVADLFDTLATIGSRFGDAGRAFVDQFGLAPVTAGFDEAAEIFRGLGERLRELVLLPFTLATDRSSDRIRRLELFWQRSVAFVRAVIDSLIQLLPLPVRPPDAEAGTAGRGITKSDPQTVEETVAPSTVSSPPALDEITGTDRPASLRQDVDKDALQRGPDDEVESEAAGGSAEKVEGDASTLVIDDDDSTAQVPQVPPTRSKSTKPVGAAKATPTQSVTQPVVERPESKNRSDTGSPVDDNDD